MNIVTLLGAMMLIPATVDAGSYLNPVYKALEGASKAEAVPYRLLRAICQVESNLNPKAVNKYDGGSASYGLCQIKLATAKYMGYRGNSKLLLTPSVNALYAAKYLRYQLDRYGNDWVRAISAYNRGKSSAKIKNKMYVHKVIRRAVGL